MQIREALPIHLRITVYYTQTRESVLEVPDVPHRLCHRVEDTSSEVDSFSLAPVTATGIQYRYDATSHIQMVILPRHLPVVGMRFEKRETLSAESPREHCSEQADDSRRNRSLGASKNKRKNEVLRLSNREFPERKIIAN